MPERLTAATWTDKAMEVLAKRGVGEVRVEPLARELGVTKGSFYWHFEDRQALLDAVIDAWEERATTQVIEVVEQTCDAPADRLRELTRRVFRHGGPLDRAVRAWASHDDGVAERVAKVDGQRYAYVRGLLEAHGQAPSIAAMRARLFYMALIGEQHTSLTLSRKRRVEWALANLEWLLCAS